MDFSGVRLLNLCMAIKSQNIRVPLNTLFGGPPSPTMLYLVEQLGGFSRVSKLWV